jgi:hypothetical protein
VIYSIRAWLHDRAEQTATGWAAAFADSASPARWRRCTAIPPTRGRWRTWPLAPDCRGRRSRGFATVVGRPPLAYLTSWPMTIVYRMLATATPRSAWGPVRRVFVGSSRSPGPWGLRTTVRDVAPAATADDTAAGAGATPRRPGLDQKLGLSSVHARQP